MEKSTIERKALSEIIAETIAATVKDAGTLKQHFEYAARMTMKVIQMLQLIEKDVLISDILTEGEAAQNQDALSSRDLRMDQTATEIVAAYRGIK